MHACFNSVIFEVGSYEIAFLMGCFAPVTEEEAHRPISPAASSDPSEPSELPHDSGNIHSCLSSQTGTSRRAQSIPTIV